MSRRALALRGILVAGALLIAPSLAHAQNYTCPTPPLGDSSNKCASTAFVARAVNAPALTQNHIFVGNASNVSADVPMSGDCTIVGSGQILCLSTNLVPFAPSATTDTTNASNISSGTLALGRLSLSTAFFYVGNGSSNPVGVGMSGDCTLASSGSVTCTKTNGAAFAPSATIDTTNAGNISSGTLPAGRLPTPTASTLGGVQSLTCSTSNWFRTLSTAGVFGCSQPSFSDLTGQVAAASQISGQVLIANGGSGQSTAAAARGTSGFNIDGATPTGDANYTILATDRMVFHTALTAARTDTLPAANAVNPGQIFVINDFRGVATASNTVTLQRAGADTINGVTSIIAVGAQYAAGIFWSDGVSRWTFFPAGSGGAGVTNVSTAGILTGGPITSTGTLNVNATITPQGRLTLVSGTPVMATSQAAQTNVLYTPYTGYLLPMYDGTNMVPIAVPEISQATTDTTQSPAAVANNSCYDLFVWNPASPKLSRGPLWTNTTTPSAGSALTLVNGIYLNSVSITNGPAASRGTWVGMMCSNGTATIDYIFGGVTAGGLAGSFQLWNAYNRVPVTTFVGDSTASWGYAVATTWRAANGSATMRVSFVARLPRDGVSAEYIAFGQAGSGATSAEGVGFNSTTAFCGTTAPGNSVTFENLVGKCSTIPAPGLNFFSAIEYNSNTTSSSWIGSNGGSFIQTGMHASVWQ